MRLSQFINEAHLDFTFEQFEDFLELVVNWKHQSHPVYLWVLDRYGDKIATAFSHICSCRTYIKQSLGINQRQLYDYFKNLNQKRWDSLIGAGGYGAVLDRGDKVIKISYAGWEPQEMAFYEYQKKYKRKEFPVIYRLTDRLVVMEKVDTDPVRSKEYGKWNSKNWMKLDNPVPVGKYDEYFLEWSLNVAKWMKEMDHPAIGWPGDIRTPNIGWRGDQLVVFDI